MKVLVATKEKQGARSNDFSWVDEGELVGFGSECDGEDIDGSCGCRRSFSGLVSHKATTTAKVVELDMTIEDLSAAVRASLESGGWLGNTPEDEVAAWVKEDTDELAGIANTFPVGSVLEKRGNSIQVRS